MRPQYEQGLRRRLQIGYCMALFEAFDKAGEHLKLSDTIAREYALNSLARRR